MFQNSYLVFLRWKYLLNYYDYEFYAIYNYYSIALLTINAAANFEFLILVDECHFETRYDADKKNPVVKLLLFLESGIH